MAKVGFKPTNCKSRKRLIIGDCDIGDIIYIEDNQIFGLIIDKDVEESKIADLADGDTDYCDNQALCRKFVGKIDFNVEDFLEFI